MPEALLEPQAAQSPSLAQRLQIREEFFRSTGIDPRQFLQAFDQVPGLFYFVKDAQSRTLLNTREYGGQLGCRSEEEVVGRRAGEYLAKSLAEHYERDDQHVLSTGEPLRNIIEIGFDDQGVPDWIITDKYPLRDLQGRVIGIMGTMQSLEGRLRSLPLLGEVGRAADFIRKNLAQRMRLRDIAAHVGLSERQLQRLFHQSLGMTIQHFVIRSRIHAAARELSHTRNPLAQIAMHCGFSDQSAFTNTFHKVLGMTPSEYRKRHLKNLIR
jgi:AraC-like DNA-binding protein